MIKSEMGFAVAEGKDAVICADLATLFAILRLEGKEHLVLNALYYADKIKESDIVDSM